MFVHGAGGGGWEWDVWGRVFAAAGFRVSAPDLQPAAGGLAATTLADYAAQVGDWLADARAEGAGDAVLVGASLGGLLALMNADGAQALVLVNPLPPSGLPAPEPVPDVLPWRRRATLAGTRRAMPDADDFAALLAFRRWRDDSGLALRQARAGVPLVKPACPVRVIASEADADVPPAVSAALARSLGASLQGWPGSHVGPLLGRGAATVAAQTVEWLNGPGPPRGVQVQLGAPG